MGFVSLPFSSPRLFPSICRKICFALFWIRFAVLNSLPKSLFRIILMYIFCFKAKQFFCRKEKKLLTIICCFYFKQVFFICFASLVSLFYFISHIFSRSFHFRLFLFLFDAKQEKDPLLSLQNETIFAWIFLKLCFGTKNERQTLLGGSNLKKRFQLHGKGVPYYFFLPTHGCSIFCR
jgi:hypothetical protein